MGQESRTPTEPGWYDDPSGEKEYQAYWDGERWTGETRWPPRLRVMEEPDPAGFRRAGFALLASISSIVVLGSGLDESEVIAEIDPSISPPGAWALFIVGLLLASTGLLLGIRVLPGRSNTGQRIAGLGAVLLVLPAALFGLFYVVEGGLWSLESRHNINQGRQIVDEALVAANAQFANSFERYSILSDVSFTVGRSWDDMFAAVASGDLPVERVVDEYLELVGNVELARVRPETLSSAFGTPTYDMDSLIGILVGDSLCDNPTRWPEEDWDSSRFTECRHPEFEGGLVVETHDTIGDRVDFVSGLMRVACREDPRIDGYWYVHGDTWQIGPAAPRLPSVQTKPVVDQVVAATGGQLNSFTCRQILDRAEEADRRFDLWMSDVNVVQAVLGESTSTIDLP